MDKRGLPLSVASRVHALNRETLSRESVFVE